MIYRESGKTKLKLTICEDCVSVTERNEQHNADRTDPPAANTLGDEQLNAIRADPLAAIIDGDEKLNNATTATPKDLRDPCLPADEVKVFSACTILYFFS